MSVDIDVLQWVATNLEQRGHPKDAAEVWKAIAALEPAERLKTALRELWLSLHETEDGGLFEDFTQERWDQFKAAYDQASAALAPAPTEERVVPDSVDINRLHEGTEVAYTLPNNGWPAHQARARERLEPGRTYRVARFVIHGSWTELWLEGVPGASFNSVQFTEVAPAPIEEEGG